MQGLIIMADLKNKLKLEQQIYVDEKIYGEIEVDIIFDLKIIYEVM